MIPKEKIEEIREKADIVAIVSEYVPIKKRGKNYLALCPFHSEKTPSFTVSQEKQLFHCFGCGEGGNVFAFIMKMEKVEFPEAAEIIGEKLGIQVEKTKGSGISKSYRERLYDLMELACKFYENNLDSGTGAPARAYMAKRGLKPESVKYFRLGFAEDNSSGLFKYLASRGAKAEEIEAAGLILPRQPADRFRNRLMFPIFNVRGKTIGFSGRALNNEEPKYLNSPDSMIFYKGENLFALNFAKEEIKKNKFVLLVEGNLDVLSCHEAGLKNTAAPLGTSLTLSQAKLISRFTNTVVLAFDSDAAGLAASERAHEVLSEVNLLVRIMELGKFKDPDEFLKSSGKEAFVESLKKSLPATEFKIKRILARFNLSEVEARARAAYDVAGLLAKEKDRIVQSEYIKYAAGLLKMGDDLLSAEVKKRSFYKKSSALPQRSITGKPPDKIAEAEKNLIRLAIESEEAFNLIKENLATEDFTNPNCREILNKLRAVPAQALLSSLESEAQQKLVREALLIENLPENINQVALDCINAIKSYHIKRRIEGLRQEIESEEKSGDLEKVKKLSSDYKTLSEILRTLTR